MMFYSSKPKVFPFVQSYNRFANKSQFTGCFCVLILHVFTGPGRCNNLFINQL